MQDTTFKVTNIKTGATRSFSAGMKASEAVRIMFAQDMPNITTKCPVSGRYTMTVVAKMGKRTMNIWVESNTSEVAGYPERSYYEGAMYSISAPIKPIVEDPEGEE